MPAGGGHPKYFCRPRKTGLRKAVLLDSAAAARAHECMAASAGRLYTDEEARFLLAVDAWRRTHQRTWLTACDYLTVAKDMGYRLPAEAER